MQLFTSGPFAWDPALQSIHPRKTFWLFHGRPR